LQGIQAVSVHAFNVMGGELDWKAMDDVAEYLEIRNDEIELFIDNLIALKDYQASKRAK